MTRITRTGGNFTNRKCSGCGIPLTDGYTNDCAPCSNRRHLRLKRGNLFTPSGYAGELIDNTTGRLVAGELEVA